MKSTDRTNKERCRRYRQRLRQRAFAVFFALGENPKCKECQKTPLKKPLHFAHLCETGLKGHGRGLTQRFMDVLKNPNCYTVLCEKCHKLMDSKKPVDTDNDPF